MRAVTSVVDALTVHVVPGERQRIHLRAPVLGGEHLINVHPVMREAVRAAGEVDRPDAVAPLPGDRARLVLARLEAARPELGRSRVMAPQRFDVGDLEAAG